MAAATSLGGQGHLGWVGEVDHQAWLMAGWEMVAAVVADWVVAVAARLVEAVEACLVVAVVARLVEAVAACQVAAVVACWGAVWEVWALEATAALDLQAAAIILPRRSTIQEHSQQASLMGTAGCHLSWPLHSGCCSFTCNKLHIQLLAQPSQAQLLSPLMASGCSDCSQACCSPPWLLGQMYTHSFKSPHWATSIAVFTRDPVKYTHSFAGASSSWLIHNLTTECGVVQ